MCGRYASSSSPEDLVEEFEVAEPVLAAPLAPDYNVAPTKSVYAVVQRPPEDGADPVRQLRVLQWGLVPSWAKDPSIGSRMINARSETVADKPAFRAAFARRRCLLPADGYYEWYETQARTSSGKARKQPFFLSREDGRTLAMAGLFEIWRDPDKADDAEDRYRWTCTVITTRAEGVAGHIHDRMPMTVRPEAYATWLDPAQSDRDALAGLLLPAAGVGLRAWPVGAEVGNVRNNGPQLLEPLEAEDDGGSTGRPV